MLQVSATGQTPLYGPVTGATGHSQATQSEIIELCALGRNGPDALVLLMLLRAEHGARGKPFRIAPTAMQLPGWSKKRCSAATNLLLAGGKLRLVSPRKAGCRPALYALAEGADQ